MAYVSRTVNPLHFEDLEPHRFEDLIRQLAYEFKPWRKLEATGRSGSDEGFDARGWEAINLAPDNESDKDGEADTVTVDDRVWLIQCKREKAIGPTKLVGYLADIPETERPSLYGIVLAAPCEFSKKGRDAFLNTCRNFGVSECHLWGKGELEDMLFQPKNDHLLFAYFGFSLSIRRRSARTALRSRLAMKRKAYRTLSGHLHRSVLIRDPQATQYPNEAGIPDFDVLPPWRVYELEAFTHAGVKFKLRRSFAYIADDKTSWDAALADNDAVVRAHENPWAGDEAARHEMRAKIFAIWEKLPDKNKAWLQVYGLVPYEAILDIDEDGDDVAEFPHLYAPFEHHGRPFEGLIVEINNIAASDAERVEKYLATETQDRTVFFPEEFRHAPRATTVGTQPSRK